MNNRNRTPMGLMLLFIVIFGVIINVNANWDFAVTIDNEIDFIGKNGNLISKLKIANISKIVSSAYDDDKYTMFLSDRANNNYSIFSVNLAEKNIIAKPILKRDSDSKKIVSMAFDSGTRTLFWLTYNALWKMSVPLDKEAGAPVLLHKLDTKQPSSIAIDSCNRYIYWVNSNRESPSIMRSKFDGSNRTIVIQYDIDEPFGVVVDHKTSKIYWLDDEEGVHYKIEQSNLDGSERSVLVRGQNHQPLHIAVDEDNVYWIDSVYNAIWRISKNAKVNDQPISFKSFYNSTDDIDPTNIMVKVNLGNSIDCKAMKNEEVKRKTNMLGLVVPKPSIRNSNNHTASMEQGNQVEVCFNGGISKKNGSCKCKPGYTGSRCEISPCHNYCLRGDCFVNNQGTPICKCSDTHNGLRCENDICDGYCLNNGRCSVNNGKPFCECKYSSGVRCEVTFDMAEICTLYCTNRQFEVKSIDTSSCRCDELNRTIEEVLGYDTFNCTILVPLLSGFVGMLTIVVIFLSVYVNKLRRRPRIKKRFVVNKNGITPLTSRPGSQLPADQCEITIENCCNMNICETPCFEPKLRTSNVRSNGMKKEEKSGLLDHMDDGGNSC